MVSHPHRILFFASYFSGKHSLVAYVPIFAAEKLLSCAGIFVGGYITDCISYFYHYCVFYKSPRSWKWILYEILSHA